MPRVVPLPVPKMEEQPHHLLNYHTNEAYSEKQSELDYVEDVMKLDESMPWAEKLSHSPLVEMVYSFSVTLWLMLASQKESN